MPIRASSLGNNVSTAVDREIGSQYDNVKTVAENIESVVTVADHIDNVDTVATNIVDVHAVGGSIVDVRTVAANIDNVVAVATDTNNVNTVASNIGKLDIVIAEVIPNMDEILLADDNATIATTKATEASTSAAEASTSAAEASTSAANALVSKQNAKASELAAAASKAVAVAKAAEADASATAAHNSELAAAAILDAFDDRCLGSYIKDPVLDNDGQPLLDGALYFNTSSNVLKVYDQGTSAWLTIPQIRLSGLVDVQLTSIATGDVLKWDGTKWINTNEFSNHVVDTNNPHYVTKSQVGLSNVDNTSDATKNVLSATKLTTARAISLTGDVTGTVNFDGSADVSIAAVVADGSHVHGNSTITDVDWTKISNKPDPIVTVALTGDVTGTANTTLTDLGNGTITVNTVVGDDSHLHSFANLKSKPTTLSGYGVTDAINISQKGVANGVATLDASGLVPVGQLPSYVDDVLEYTNLGAFPAVGEPGKIYVALDTNKTYRWSGTVYIYITSGAVDSVAGKTGVVTLTKADVGLGNVDNTTDLLKPLSTATTNALALKADDSTVVHKTGDETIAGVKTFTDGLKLQGQNVSPFSGFKNYIINGNFDIWQRGTSQTTTGYGSADRWSSNINGNGTFQMSRSIDDTLNGRRINTYAASLVTVGTTTEIGLATRLEDMMRFAGKTLTLSFYAISDSTAPINVYYGRYYTSMIYSSSINVGNGVSSVLTKYTTTFTVPAYAGESYSPVNSFLEILIRQARTIAGGFRVAQVQLEEGSVATPFEQRPYGLELSLCQRYYEQLEIGLTSGAISTANQYLGQRFMFLVTKRTVPTVALIAGTDGQLAFPSGAATFVPSIESVLAYKSSTSADNNANWYQKISVSAEL